MADGASLEHPQKDDETALLIAALNHSSASFDARISRGLQVVNYYLVAVAVLANAYVSALNAKLYAVAAVIGLSAVPLTGVTFMVGFRQRQMADPSERALIEVQDRVASRLGIDALRIARAQPRPDFASAYVAFALAALLSTGSVLYALIH
jgi:hypothetical protein